MVLIMGTPKKLPLILGNPQVCLNPARKYHHEGLVGIDMLPDMNISRKTIPTTPQNLALHTLPHPNMESHKWPYTDSMSQAILPLTQKILRVALPLCTPKEHERLSSSTPNNSLRIQTLNRNRHTQHLHCHYYQVHDCWVPGPCC